MSPQELLLEAESWVPVRLFACGPGDRSHSICLNHPKGPSTPGPQETGEGVCMGQHCRKNSGACHGSGIAIAPLKKKITKLHRFLSHALRYLLLF